MGTATQGKDEKEVRENMADLIEEYFQDPDILKPALKIGKSHGKVTAIAAR